MLTGNRQEEVEHTHYALSHSSSLTHSVTTQERANIGVDSDHPAHCEKMLGLQTKYAKTFLIPLYNE